MSKKSPVGTVRKTRAVTHPCIFSTPFLREQIDPRIKAIWPDAPFGNLRKLWREQACKTINPYDSRWCPYRPEDCALSFWKAVEQTVYAMPRKSKTGYFRAVAHTMGMDLAERKPLARESVEGPGHAGDTNPGATERQGLRGAHRRPVAIGEVLGSLAARSHPRQERNGSGETQSEE